jgi:hypothetical protein
MICLRMAVNQRGQQFEDGPEGRTTMPTNMLQLKLPYSKSLPFGLTGGTLIQFGVIWQLKAVMGEKWIKTHSYSPGI